MSAIDLSREDLQTIADMRMIALAQLKRTEQSHSHDPYAVMSAMRQIADICAHLIAQGPPEFRFIIEETAPLEVIQHELRSSVFRERDFIDVRRRT